MFIDFPESWIEPDLIENEKDRITIMIKDLEFSDN
jgi:hypothetical protein